MPRKWMKTKDLIERLREIGYAAENPEDCGLTRDEEKNVRRVVDEVIRRLKEPEELKAYLHKDVLDEVERLRKKSGK